MDTSEHLQKEQKEQSSSSTSFFNTENQTVVNSSDGTQPKSIAATRPKRGRKPRVLAEQNIRTTAQIQETAIQETATQETTTMVIEQFPPDATIDGTSSIQQISRPKRGRKPKNSSPEQSVGTKTEILQIREATTQETTAQETPPDTAIVSTQQISRPKRGRKPKDSSLEQPVGTETEILQIQEVATQETTAQETTTTMVIEQLFSDATVASTSSTQQISRPRRGRKPKNSSPEQSVGTEPETLQIQEAATQETTAQEIPPDAAIASTNSTQQVSRPKRGRKPKYSSPEQSVETETETLQIQEAATQETTVQEIPPDTAIASTSSTQQISRPKRGRKPKNYSPEQSVGTETETLQIQEAVTQETTAQEIPPDTAIASTSSTQQISRPRRGRKPKDSSPEQSVGTETETLQIQEAAIQETPTTVIEQLPPEATVASTSSTQQISRPRRGRKPKNSSPEQSVETETETFQIREPVTQETTDQETTTTIIEQLLPDATVASTSSTQQISRPRRGRKPKDSSSGQPVGTEAESLQIQEMATQETTAQTTEEPTNVASTSASTSTSTSTSTSASTSTSTSASTSASTSSSTSASTSSSTSASTSSSTSASTSSSIRASTTSNRGRKRKAAPESSTTANQVVSDNPITDEGVSEGNPPKRGRKNVSEQEAVEVPGTTAGATSTHGKKRKATTENNNEENNNEEGPAKENKRSKRTKRPVEKRLARIRKSCTAPIYERIIRAEQQRIYMVNRKKVNDTHEEFAILGSTGNVYTVTITHLPNCTCPDFKKGNLCKHIFFVYLRVFRLSRDNSYIYQKALVSKELRSIFANAFDPTVLASKRVRDKYKTFTSGKFASDTNENEKRRPIEGNCPICYELLEEKDHKNIVWCKEGCGNNLHKDCFEQWKKSKRGDKVTCVYCRANWGESDSGIVINEEGYVNLGNVQGMSTIRDTTFYYRNYRTWF